MIPSLSAPTSSDDMDVDEPGAVVDAPITASTSSSSSSCVFPNGCPAPGPFLHPHSDLCIAVNQFLSRHQITIRQLHTMIEERQRKRKKQIVDERDPGVSVAQAIYQANILGLHSYRASYQYLCLWLRGEINSPIHLVHRWMTPQGSRNIPHDLQEIMNTYQNDTDVTPPHEHATIPKKRSKKHPRYVLVCQYCMYTFTTAKSDVVFCNSTCSARYQRQQEREARFQTSVTPSVIDLTLLSNDEDNLDEEDNEEEEQGNEKNMVRHCQICFEVLEPMKICQGKFCSCGCYDEHQRRQLAMRPAKLFSASASTVTFTTSNFDKDPIIASLLAENDADDEILLQIEKELNQDQNQHNDDDDDDDDTRNARVVAAAIEMNLIRRCPQCDVIFEPKYYYYDSAPRRGVASSAKCCSRKCGIEYWARRRVQKQEQEQEQTKAVHYRTCVYCKCKLYKKQRLDGHNVCSEECSFQFRKLLRSITSLPLRKMKSPSIKISNPWSNQNQIPGDDVGWTIRCVCGDNDDQTGLMIACDLCGIWQHVGCVGVESKQIPDQYYCELCVPKQKLESCKKLTKEVTSSFSSPSSCTQDPVQILNQLNQYADLCQRVKTFVATHAISHACLYHLIEVRQRERERNCASTTTTTSIADTYSRRFYLNSWLDKSLNPHFKPDRLKLNELLKWLTPHATRNIPADLENIIHTYHHQPQLLQHHKLTNTIVENNKLDVDHHIEHKRETSTLNNTNNKRGIKRKPNTCATADVHYMTSTTSTSTSSCHSSSSSYSTLSTSTSTSTSSSSADSDLSQCESLLEQKHLDHIKQQLNIMAQKQMELTMQQEQLMRQIDQLVGYRAASTTKQHSHE